MSKVLRRAKISMTLNRGLTVCKKKFPSGCESYHRTSYGF